MGKDATRRLCILGALIASLATAPLAEANGQVEIDAHITPVIRPFPERPIPVSLSIGLKFSDGQGGPAPVLDKTQISFPFGAQLNGKLFPSCRAEAIADKGRAACPKGSKIGTGTALGLLADIREELVVSLYNGPGGRSIVFFLQGDRPAIINVPFDAPLKTFRTGMYNYVLSVDVPPLLERIVGVDVSIDTFKVKVGATRRVKGRKRGYIEALICPPGALVPIRGDFTFLESPSYRTDTYIHCG